VTLAPGASRPRPLSEAWPVATTLDLSATRGGRFRLLSSPPARSPDPLPPAVAADAAEPPVPAGTRAPLLLCVHGGGHAAASFSSLAMSLRGSSVRVAALDQRGHGETRAACEDAAEASAWEADLSLDNLAEDLAAVAIEAARGLTASAAGGGRRGGGRGRRRRPRRTPRPRPAPPRSPYPSSCWATRWAAPWRPGSRPPSPFTRD